MSLLQLAGALSCVGCGVRRAALCDRCARTLPRPPHPVELPGLERVSAVWTHEGAARSLVLGLKLGGRREFAEPLVEASVRLLQRRGTESSVVAWPPCSRTDRRRRGFDHAELLARGVAMHLGLPAVRLIERVGRPADQTSLGGVERRTNLASAFAARPCDSAAVLLVDDVVTTGATLQACARALRAAGASRVEAAVPCSAY